MFENGKNLSISSQILEFTEKKKSKVHILFIALIHIMAYPRYIFHFKFMRVKQQIARG